LMNGARVGVAAQAVGIAQGALVAARDYAAVREQFGMRIQGIPAVADMLAEMTLQVEAARALLYDTARVVDKARGAARALSSLHGREGKGSEEERRELKKEAKTLDRLAGLLTPMAKYFASEMSFRVANDAVQILGGSGYMKDYPVERYLRDARITTIYEGTSQLQVVAAIRGITSGMLEPRFQELESSLREKVAVPFLQALGEARQHLTAAVETAKKAEDPGYMDLVARPIVDLAIHVYIAHLLAEQGTHSERKALLAKRWLTSLLLLSNQVHDRVESGERSTLDQFEALVYGSGI
ncbi:MAG: acyl-CoA dehydrogenase family protein, partial [Acidobacteriota bacterium]